MSINIPTFYLTDFFCQPAQAQVDRSYIDKNFIMEHCIHILKFSIIMISEYSMFGLFHCVASLMSSLTVIFGNVIIIYAFWKASSMSLAPRILMLSLAASDLGVGLIVQPTNSVIMIKLLAVIEDDGDEGDHALYPICPLIKTWQFFAIFFAGASVLTVGAISVERYLAMSLHLRYQELVTPARVLIVVTVIWITALSTALLQTLVAFNDIINSSGVFLTISLASFAYIKIYKIARRHQNQIHDQAQLQNQDNQARQMARARKLAMNSFYIYVILLICYVPSLCISPAFMMSRSPGSLLTLCYFLSASLIFYNSSLNPLVYCWKIRELRETVVDILKRLFQDVFLVIFRKTTQPNQFYHETL